MGNKNSGVRPKNIIGKRFGKLTVTHYAGNSKWECVCDCGNVATVSTCRLNSGHTKSCGCLKNMGYHTTHGKRYTRLYRKWTGTQMDKGRNFAGIAERLRGVQIEHMDATELIKRFNHSNVLIYCDPPYILQTRHGKQYRCEMDDQQHERLLDALEAHTGPVILSGYESPLYNERLRKWHREERIAYSQVASRKQEVIWMNFEPEKNRQSTLFDLGE